MRQWYALKSKARMESTAATLLNTSGIETYLPQLKVHKRPWTTPVLEPLFPGYLFSRLDPAQGEIRLATYTHGVLYVVGFGDQPYPVDDELITAIQDRLAGRQSRATPAFRSGERVVITSGPLRDVEAVFDRQLSPAGRVQVLIQILERQCRVEVHAGQLRRSSKAASVA